MPTDREPLSALVDRLYDAAAGFCGWDGVLSDLARLLGGSAARACGVLVSTAQRDRDPLRQRWSARKIPRDAALPGLGSREPVRAWAGPAVGQHPGF